MRGAIFGCAAAGMLLSAGGQAFSADMPPPVYKAPIYKAPAAVPFSWSGLYVGAHVGGAWSHEDWFYPGDALNSVAFAPGGTPFNVSSGAHAASSWLAGGQVGYNFQVQNWVLGLEGEFSSTDLDGSHVDPSFPNINHTRTDFLATLGGRIGFGWDRLLVFGKAGVGWAHDKFFDTATATVSTGTPPVTQPAGSVEDQAAANRFGPMVGGGIEYAITPNWSIKAEYEHLDLGRQRTTLTPTAAGLAPIDENIAQRFDLVKIGVNYRFGEAGFVGGPAPYAYAQAGGLDPARRFYGGAEYLLWSVKGAPISVPLVATGPVSNKEGFLVNSATTILYGASFAPASGGNDTQNFPLFSGSRLSLGYWLDDAQRLAVEGSGFFLQRRSAGYSIAGNSTSGNPPLRVPVYSAVAYAPGGKCDQAIPTACLIAPTEDGVPIDVPGSLYGSVTVTNSLQFWGLDATTVLPFYRVGGWELSGETGFRYLDLTESLNLSTTLIGISTSKAFAGQSGYTVDEFDTHNQFYGAVLGLRGQYLTGPFSLAVAGRVSLGVSHEELNVSGYYQDSGATFAATSGPYGIFAMPANEGRFTSNQFAVVPEAKVKLGYDLTPWMRLTVGYDFIYYSNVVRPGDQINRSIAKGQTYQQDGTPANPSVPASIFKTTDFYVHGLNAGVTVRF